MGEKLPGSVCGWSLGPGWMDWGTLGLTRNTCPGPTGTVAEPLSAGMPAAVPAPDDSMLEYLRRQFIVGAILGLRRTAATLDPMGLQALTHDEQQAWLLLAQGDYEQAFEVATGLQAYFQIHHQAQANGSSGGSTAVAMLGHLTGFNQATAAVSGEDMAGKPLGAGERIMAGLDGLIRIASTAMTVGGVVGSVGARLRPVRVLSPVYRIAGRDIVVVETSLGRQTFYRSSGANSGMPGEWLPVDEFRHADGWFNKANYVHGPGLEEGQALHRFGNEEFRRISRRLGEMHIPTGQQVPAGAHEPAEATLNRILDFFGARRTPTTVERPVPQP